MTFNNKHIILKRAGVNGSKLRDIAKEITGYYKFFITNFNQTQFVLQEDSKITFYGK